MRFKRQAAALFAAAAAFTSCSSFTEATLPGNDDLDGTIGRLERVTGLAHKEAVVREFAPAGMIAAAAAASPLRCPAGPSIEFDRELWLLLRPAERTAALAALPRAVDVADAAAYDFASRRMLLANPSVDPASCTGRRADVVRFHAFAVALLDQSMGLRDALNATKRSRDEREALLAFVEGAAYVATLEASLAPIAVVDVSDPHLVELHETIVRMLLDDPDGGAVRLLANPTLPDVTRFALDDIAAAEDQDRARLAARRFLGARFVLEGKRRLGASNFARIVSDPPRSTEELLHPDLYFDRDDPPAHVVREKRGGLLGPGNRLESAGVVGELGIREALASVVGPRRAATAAAGWNADLLSIYANEAGARSFAWRLEFEQRFDAGEFVDEIKAALIARHGGSFVEVEDGAYSLEHAGVAAFVERRIARVSVVVGGSVTRQRAASTALLDEVVEEVESRDLASAGRQTFAFQWSRILASPVFFDQPGRFDTLVRSGFGVLFSHRAYPGGALHEALNPDCFPLLGAWLPPDSSAALFRAETGPSRGRFDVLCGLLFSRYRNRDLDGTRIRTPIVSWSQTPEHRSWDVLGGLGFSFADGAGHSEFSPRPAYSQATALDGAEASTGVLFDAVRWSRRDGRDTDLQLLPFGLLADLRRDAGTGFDFGLLADFIHVQRREVIADAPHRSWSLGWGLLGAYEGDAAAACSRTSILAGLAFHRRSTLLEQETGFFRIGSRSLYGFGHDGPHRFRDVLFLRFDAE